MSEQVPTSWFKGKGRVRQAGAILVPVVLIALLAWLIRPAGDDAPNTERFVTEVKMLPPPPPEPEQEEPIMEEEEEIIEPSEEPPSETPTDEPVDQPQDTTDTNASNELAGLDRPADAGSDSFRLAAGGGGGLFGRGAGGGGGGEWGSYVEGHIRRALMRDPRTRAARGSLRVQVTIAEDGRFTGASLRSSTGNAELDEAVRRVLANLPRLSVGRPRDREAVTFASINMKRN